MKKIILPVFVLLMFAACNSNGTIDESKLDSAGAKLQNTVETTADSIVTKVDRWADSLDNDRDPDTLR